MGAAAPGGAIPSGAAARATLAAEVVRLRLRHTWTTVMSSGDYRDNLHPRYSREGVAGLGEAAPIVRYQEDAASARTTVESLRPLLEAAGPWQFARLMREVFLKVKGENAAKAALDIALLD